MRTTRWTALLCVGALTLACDDVTGPALPDQGLIVFTSIDQRFLRIWITDLDGSLRVALTPDDETSLEPSWIPGGGLTADQDIVYTSWRDGDANIYRMSRDGTNRTALTSHPANDRSGRFSPGGLRLAFVSERDGQPDVFLLSAGGRPTPENLTNSPTSRDVDPEWSPDGQQIVFASDRGTPGVFSLWTMRADGSDLRRLPADGGARSPAWSPDGTKIAFTSVRDVGDAEIYVMNADGSNQENLTRWAGIDELPRWSPTGAHILFSTKRGGQPEIYAMAADGSGPTNVTRNDIWDAMADWWRPSPLLGSD